MNRTELVPRIQGPRIQQYVCNAPSITILLAIMLAIQLVRLWNDRWNLDSAYPWNQSTTFCWITMVTAKFMPWIKRARIQHDVNYTMAVTISLAILVTGELDWLGLVGRNH